MRSNIIDEILLNITEEEKAEHKRITDEFLAKERWLEDNGYIYNTDKSYSIKLLNDKGHFPIGITRMMSEETFIFRTEREATKAWKSRTLGYEGWFYGIESFRKEKKEYEEQMETKLKIYWLWKSKKENHVDR